MVRNKSKLLRKMDKLLLDATKRYGMTKDAFG